MGRPQEAVTSLKKAAAIDPNKMFASAHIARFELILENYVEAAKWTQHLRDSGHFDDAALVDGESDFLQDHYSEAQAKFEALRNSNDPVYRSYGYSLLARLFAEIGQYKNAFEALDQGIAADLGSGDNVSRADKLLDRAYLNFKRRRYDGCSKDLREALALDRSLQRSLVAGTLAGRAASANGEASKKNLRSQLGEIERLLPGRNVEPLSLIVRARLRGEALLADGQWKQALQQFNKAHELEAPVKDKEYLARGSLVAARHSNQAAAARMTAEAVSAYAALVSKPGQIWQWALDYPPGYLSDETLALLKVSSQRAQLDTGGKAVLSGYLKRRLHADHDVTDVEEAKRIQTQSLSVRTN